MKIVLVFLAIPSSDVLPSVSSASCSCSAAKSSSSPSSLISVSFVVGRPDRRGETVASAHLHLFVFWACFSSS